MITKIPRAASVLVVLASLTGLAVLVVATSGCGTSLMERYVYLRPGQCAIIETWENESRICAMTAGQKMRMPTEFPRTDNQGDQ